MKNLRASSDVQKQSFLFSGDPTWPPRDIGIEVVGNTERGQSIARGLNRERERTK